MPTNKLSTLISKASGYEVEYARALALVTSGMRELLATERIELFEYMANDPDQVEDYADQIFEEAIENTQNDERIYLNYKNSQF